MNAARNQPSPDVVKFKVAHLKVKGVDLVFVLLDAGFGRLPKIEQEKATQSLRHFIAGAGLRGFVVPIWDKGTGTAEFLAEKQLHPLLQSISLTFVQQNINRELSIKGAHFSNQFLNSSRTPEVVRPGVIMITCEVADAQVFLDGSFVGNIPAKIKVNEGSHVVEVKRAGYKDFRKELQITADSEINLRPELEYDIGGIDPFSESMDFAASSQDRGKVAAFQRKHRIGLVTLLFTDMVGSTKLKQELGDRDAVKMIQSHHEEVRNILRKYPTGEEISTAGDSFFLVFAKPSDAVKFALHLQARIRIWARNYTKPIRDRIGIHVGEVFIEEVDGSGKVNDLYGIQVDSSARVMSLAEGDQILLTRFAFDNARQVLKGQSIEGVKELAWKNHGLYTLKGVEEPLEICEVGEVGLAALTPPGDSEKAHRFSSAEGELQQPGSPPPAPSTAQSHVVVSTKNSFPLKPLRPGASFSSIIKNNPA